MSCPFDYDEGLEEDDDEYLNCALGPDGQCGKAGSEECDWECPHSHGEFYAGSEAWHRKHNAGLPVADCECSECRTARRKAAFAAALSRQFADSKGKP